MEQGRLTFDLKPVVITEILQEALAGLDLKAQEKNIYLKIEYLEIEPTTVINTDTTKFKEVIVNKIQKFIARYSFGILGPVTPAQLWGER